MIRIILIFSLYISLYSQTFDLNYIFHTPPLINPRPSIKAINSSQNKLYYYADPDHNQTLELFEYNYVSGSTIQVSDSTKSYSEFHLLENGDLATIIKGDIFISKNFTETNEFREDIRYTNTDEYEYDIIISGNALTFRRAGNYMLKLINATGIPEVELTSDESDSIANQMLALSGTGDNAYAVFARYNNFDKQRFYIPDYTKEFVTMNPIRKGVGSVTYFLTEVSKKDSRLISEKAFFRFPGNDRWYIHSVKFSLNKTDILFDIESLDRRTRKLFLYTIDKNEMKEIYTEYYEAGWFERHKTVADFVNENNIIFESEINGYNSIYKLELNSLTVTPAAKGDYTVEQTVIDRKKNKLYVIANPGDPTEWNIYEADISSSLFKKISSGNAGYENMYLSGDGSMLFYTFSRTNIPEEIYSLNTNTYEEKQVTNTISPAYSGIDWIVPEFITFPNYEDGITIHARLYKPKDISRNKMYPLICFAHGSGYLQNAMKGFAWYSDNFMVHSYFVQQGYIVLDVDYRGSAGYGADFRNKTWQNLGYWEVSDYISGIKYLESLGYIDRNKVGIYGGSYGGFITLMSVMKHPEYFRAGAALRAVSDWLSYSKVNPWFVLGRLGDPEVNEETYKISSPISFAQDLNVPLLLMHGMLDDNVFFQQSVQLSQKLIENKKDFEVMYYPKENHSFYLQSSWLDEYKRIFNFFEKNIKQ